MSTLLMCLTCGARPARTRGNCNRCWSHHAAAIARGETTWAQLERQGLARAPQQRGNAWRGTFRIGRKS